VLVEALALLPAPPPAYLVGDGPLRGVLTRLIRSRGLDAVVHLPGWSYEPGRYIAGASVHVVPSREEAWSQSAVLALGLGVPVVGTAVDGLARTLGGGRGVLVPPEAPRALAAQEPRPCAGPGIRPPVHPQRSCRGVRRSLLPAARQSCRIREASRAAALTPAPPGLKSLPGGPRVLAGATAPASCQPRAAAAGGRGRRRRRAAACASPADGP